MNYVLGVEVKQPVTHAHDDGAFVFWRQLWRQNRLQSEIIQTQPLLMCAPFTLGHEFNKKKNWRMASCARQLHLKLKQPLVWISATNCQP